MAVALPPVSCSADEGLRIGIRKTRLAASAGANEGAADGDDRGSAATTSTAPTAADDDHGGAADGCGYDRLVARGKKGVTAIRGENCSSCHIRVPIGAIMTLKRGEDLQLCESCGRYLYLPDTAETETPPPPAPPKRAKKPRAAKRESRPA